MTAFPTLALLIALTAFLGLLAHLRWDRIAWSRVGALPLHDEPEEIDRVHSRS